MIGKILGIGLQRTGTTSLHHALKKLGIRAAPHAIPLYHTLNEDFLNRYEAFTDNPIPLIYKSIDQKIPECKFILTTRSLESWPVDVNSYNRSRYEANISLLASQELLNDEVKLELVWVQNLNHGDGMFRPKASYFVRSNFKLMIGWDIFFGNERGIFGQFADRNRLSLGLEWGI